MAMRIYLSIIILNVNELNIPIKRHKCQVGFFFFFNQGPTIYCLQETHFRVKDTQTEGEGMEKDFLYT